MTAAPGLKPRRGTVRTADGLELAYRVWDAPAPRATLVALNGIMSNAGWFAPLAPGLGAAGLTLVGADRRGSGPNREGWGDAPSAAALVEDVLAVIDAAHDSSRPLLLLGWCWGAALAVAVAAKLGPRLAGLVLATPGMFPTAEVKEALAGQAEALRTAPPDAAVIDTPIRDTMFTHGPALEGFVRADSDRVLKMTPRLCSISGKLATAAVARLHRLAVPLLVLLAAQDEATDNAATMAALGRIVNHRPTVVTLPGQHGIQFDAPDDVVEAVSSFADRVLR